MLLQRDPSSTEGHPEWENSQPDYTVRIDPACQYKAIIANDSRKIRLRRILDKHNKPVSNNEIDIPMLNTMELGLGEFRDAFLHRQLTGPDKDALFIIYIGSGGFYKQKIPVCSLQPTERPATRYISCWWGSMQRCYNIKMTPTYNDM
ncbi:hypothetical protein CJF30_00010969 [Rutstroemia sp. NJR-2017a BBW]|nr:hypothetical protein CJF30_00010969 [Rutstroemia sp. NJR-2017a BBW]